MVLIFWEVKYNVLYRGNKHCDYIFVGIIVHWFATTNLMFFSSYLTKVSKKKKCFYFDQYLIMQFCNYLEFFSLNLQALSCLNNY